MKIFFILLLFLTSCFGIIPSSETFVSQAPNGRKQKHKIAVLQKKLELAEREQKKAQDEVERLSGEVHQAQLTLIRKQLDDYEKQIRKMQSDPKKYAQLLQNERSTLFIEERESLHRMIQSGPSPSAFEAQMELDRILRIITELSDNPIER